MVFLTAVSSQEYPDISFIQTQTLGNLIIPKTRMKLSFVQKKKQEFLNGRPMVKMIKRLKVEPRVMFLTEKLLLLMIGTFFKR